MKNWSSNIDYYELGFIPGTEFKRFYLPPVRI